jgi:hypothetical protein
VNLYGKAAIVKSVLEAERGSKLYTKDSMGLRSFDPDRLADTWLVKFMHMLTRGVPKESAHQIVEKAAFINFNYDRCLEWFLVNAIQKVYGLEERQAEESRSARLW